MIFVDMGGRKVPALGFGTWALTGSTCERAVEAALAIGYRHIDTAQAYGNEAEVGRAVARSRAPREELFITTKIWHSNLAPAQVKSTFAESLTQLGMDYVDLLLVHWPNDSVPLKATLDAMAALKASGQVKAIGVSNFTVALMREAVEILKREIVCNQVEYHPLLSQRAVIAYARRHGIAVTAYSPLARGRIGGHPALLPIAKKHGKTVNQIVLRRLVEQDGVAAIPKTASAEHARENFAIFDFALDAADRKAIDALGGNSRIVNPGWAPNWDAA